MPVLLPTLRRAPCPAHRNDKQWMTKMSKRVLLYAAAAFMAVSSAGFVSTAMGAPRAASVHGVCANAGFQKGDVQYSDCVKTLRQFARPDAWSLQSVSATSAVPNASRFMAYAGPRSDVVTGPHDFFTGGHRAAQVRACAGLGLGSEALRQCIGNLNAATWQDDLASHG
jgi:hypothetical protein